MERFSLNQAALGRAFLIVLGLAGVLLTSLRIHGSSVVMWSVILHEEETANALIYGRPREVRSDEWLVWTPSLLAQARHVPPFPVENPVLGAGRSPMLMNLPTRHFSTIFRPQLWGYFLFDLEHGFAWNWNVKVFGLLAAMFVLIRKLARGDFWIGLLGAVWVFCSSYTQWWFSCPPMLPEMLASWALALWCSVLLLEGARGWKAFALAIGLFFATTNFVLSMYPPFQIPLVYLGLAVLAGWVWRSRSEGVKVAWGTGGVWMGGAAVAMLLVVVPFFVELLPTLRLVQGTSYPGARRATGGALNLGQLFLGLAEPFFSAKSFPEQRVNVCNAANFYPLWIAAGGWVLLATGEEGRARRKMFWPLLGCLLAMTLFALCPLPSFVGRVTLLCFTTEERLILPIGVGGVLLSVLVLGEMRAGGNFWRGKVAPFLIAAGVVNGALMMSAAGSPQFFTTVRLAEAMGLSLGLMGLYLWPMKRVFAGVLLLVILPTGFGVNPVTCGLAPLTESSVLPVIEGIRREDPDARWVAFDGANLSGFLMSAGVEVISGAKTLPDLGFYKELDPEGRDLGIYNRYSLGLFRLGDDAQTVRFKLFNFCAHEVEISPGNAVLRRRGIRYFVFPKELQGAERWGLEKLVSVPERGVWVYRWVGGK